MAKKRIIRKRPDPDPDSDPLLEALQLVAKMSSMTTLVVIIFTLFVYVAQFGSRTHFVANQYSNESFFEPYNEKVLKHWHPIALRSYGWSPGDSGAAYDVPEDEETVKRLFKKHYFNILASDRIPFDRYIGDNRDERCLTKLYPEKLPTASVIIVFHNEAWSTLLRTVHSVINTSPTGLIKEIILVDDKSTKVYLKRQLEDYMNDIGVNVKIIRQSKRLGLIKARLLGVEQSGGEVLIFLDSHVECNQGWLEPLLSRIVEDRTRVVAPVIDVIDVDDFRVLKANNDIWGGFDWKISFRWNSVPKRELERTNYDRTQPLRTPTIAGGIFAIDKQFFKYMGEYDRGMLIWGAENLEISFRMWLCGGSLEIIPCSRIAHIFRAESPYVLMGSKDKVVQHNTARLVDVWLDEWANFYYTLYPSAYFKVKRGNIADRLELRKKLKCKSFKWYLDNIYPESNLPKNYRTLGQVEHIKSATCLDSRGITNVVTAGVEMKKCHWDSEFHATVYQQTFMYTIAQQVIYDEFCLTFTDSGEILLKTCTEMNLTQKWLYSEDIRRLVQKNSGLCLEYDKSKLFVDKCNSHNENQKWFFRNNFRWKLRSK